MGASEIVIIFLIYLLLFGAKGIPSLAKTMGKAVYQFREARNDIQREIMDSAKDITNSAKQVRKEVENAAKLAENQAKKAQESVNQTIKKASSEPNPESKSSETSEKTAPPINPLTPSDSITSTGANTNSSGTPPETHT